MTDDRRFILWNLKDGATPPRSEDGSIATSGALGECHASSVYLTTYAIFPDHTRPVDLDIGGRIQGVMYNLSGSKGTYDIYRVSDSTR